jgi:hypothetical protein
MGRVTGLFLALLAAPLAQAADWNLVTKAAGATVYVDGQSIKPAGNLTSAWIRMDYDADQVLKLDPPKKFRSQRLRYAMDCKAKEFTIAEATWHGANGELTHSQVIDRVTKALEDVRPGTVAGAVYDRICPAAPQPGKP